MKKKVFFYNALVMAAGALLLRVTNIGYRVYIADKIGAAGMGLYQLILSVFMLAITISTSGISLSVTRLVAESLGCGDPGRAKNAVRKCILWGLMFSITAAAALYLLSDWIAAELFNDMRTSLPLKLLAPGLPFMAVSSCLKGYFIARRSAFQSVSGDLLEQSVTIGIVVGLFTIFAPEGMENACCAIMLGSTLGEIISCLYNYILYRLSARKCFAGCTGAGKGVFRKIVHIALPSMAGYTARNILSTIENILIPRGLKKNGASVETSLSQYGMIHGMVMPILFFPSAFLSAFSSLLIPEVAEAHAAGKKQGIIRVTRRSMQLTLLFSFFVTSVFWGFSRELGMAIYKNEQAGAILQILCPLVPLMYLDSIVDSILKGLDQQVSSLKYNFSDSAIRVMLIYFLVPVYGVKGYICVLFFSTIFNATLSIHRLIQVSEVRIQVADWIVKPALSAALSVCLILLFSKAAPWISALPDWQVAAVQIGLAGFLYYIFLRVSGSFTKEDVKWAKGIFH